MYESASGKPKIAVAVIARADQVLLIKRRVPEGRLIWQFPAGAIESEESAIAAVERETLEETGLSVRGTKVLGERKHPDTGRVLCYVACAVIAGTARVASPREVAEVIWATRDELPRYVPHGIFDPVQQYLDRVLAGPAS